MKAGIVGAGIMGQLLALNLCNAGWKVTLFDRNSESEKLNCSMAAAGLLAPVTELARNDWIICALGMESVNDYWPQIIGQLQQPIYFQKQGSLLVAHPRDQVELAQFIRILNSKLSQPIVKIKIKKIEPELARLDEGYYFAAEGCLDNQALMRALQNYLSQHIVWYHGTEVEALKPGIVETAKALYEFDVVFDCRGLAAKDNFKQLRGIRGELIWVDAPEVNIRHPVRLLHPRYSLYVVPRPHSVYILGASEIEAEDDSPISVRTLLELLSSAYSMHSGFAEARLLHSATHSRPTFPDQLPRIQFDRGLIAVNGLYRHGFLIAPALAAEVLRFLQSGIEATHYPHLWEQIHD